MIQLSFHTIVFIQYMQRCFSQIVQRVCTLVLFIILLSAYCQNSVSDRQTDGQNDKPSTVTLAAHARRGLIKWVELARNAISGWGEHDIRISVPFMRYITRARARKKVGVAISIRDPYSYIAVHEPVQMTRSLSLTGPLSMQ